MIRLSQPFIAQEEKEAIFKALEKNYLGMGEFVKSFEQDIAAYLGVEANNVVCVNTGTAALHLALQACGIKEGDEVLVPTVTYVGTFQAVSATGATPIPCDVEIDTCFIDLEDARKRLSSRTKAILPVHYAGSLCDFNQLRNFANSYNLRIIEDAAHAFGSVYLNGIKVGAIGDITCFSFDPIKNITSGQGGAIVSQDPAVISKVNNYRLLGVENESNVSYKDNRQFCFDVKEQGWRYHMSDIMAALGQAQLKKFETELKPKRMALAKYYRERLAIINGVQFLKADLEKEVLHIQPVRIEKKMREKLQLLLKKENIETGIHYRPNHFLTKYNRGFCLPVAETLYQELLSLPLHLHLTYENIDKIGEIFEAAFIDSSKLL